MSQPPHKTGDFLERLSQSIRNEQPGFAAIRVPKHEHVYLIGDQAETVYFIEQTKFARECSLSVALTSSHPLNRTPDVELPPTPSYFLRHQISAVAEAGSAVRRRIEPGDRSGDVV